MRKRVNDYTPIELRIKSRQLGYVSFYLRSDPDKHVACFEIKDLNYSKPITLLKAQCKGEPYTFKTIILKCIDVAMRERYDQFVENYEKKFSKSYLDMEDVVNTILLYKADWIYIALREIKHKVQSASAYNVVDDIFYLNKL